MAITPDHKLAIQKRIWKNWDEDQIEDFCQQVFDHYRSEGFPYFDLTESQILKEFHRLRRFDTTDILEQDDVVRQVMTGLRLANFFMPHLWAVNCHGFKSPIEAFEDDDHLMKAIRKRLQLGDNMGDSGMRKSLSWTHGVHRVSNFRPTVAKFIYDHYSGSGDILDFSCGYGGRLLGAISSKSVRSYTGTDPCADTFAGLERIAEYSDKEINLFMEPFEDLDLPDQKFDLAFSSPPYFNTEEYSHEDTQSWVRYDTIEKWRDDFLTPLIQKCHRSLKDDGWFVLNIADVNTYPDFEKDALRIAGESGFTLRRTYKMALSKLMSDGYKYEPIFVFSKTGSHLDDPVKPDLIKIQTFDGWFQ